MHVRPVPTRYALGAGVAVTTITAIGINLNDLRRMLSTLSVGSAVVLAVWLVYEVKGRKYDARMARQTELEVQQTRQLHTIAERLFPDTGDNTGPHPLRSVK